MTTPPHKTGALHHFEDDIACVLAPNPSPMTYWGTNTYIYGHDTVAVIDPGPKDDAHLAALIAAIGTRTVSHILITHSHADHSPLAPALSAKTSAPVMAFGNSAAGRSGIMKDLARSGLMGGGEGVDTAFTPDQLLADQDQIKGDGWTLTAHHTPGHFGNHLCFVDNARGFSGDLIMGWSTSLVSPPDGDLTEFMASCRALAQTGVQRLYSGHGAPITDPQKRITEILTHRKARETALLEALASADATPQDLTKQVYTDTPTALLAMAERNVLAHLVDLYRRGLIVAQGPLSATAKFTLKIR